MPNPISLTAREREVYQYYQPSDNAASSAQSGQRTNVPRSSSDPVLTAFAQLGAHRLRAKRGLITLSTRDTEYILAESGVGLSLQQDDDKNDPLWHGSVALSKKCGLGMRLCRHFCTSEENISYAAFDDLRKYDEFKDQQVVAQAPHIRFLACVPLRSSLSNMIIGTYIVVDDKPRDGLNEDEIEFMVDMGVTVIDHLDAQRNNRKQYRAERMVKAISLFIEGKSTLREWWLSCGHKTQHTKVTKRVRNITTSLDGQADIEFGVQDPVEQVPPRAMASIYQSDGRPPLSRSPSSSTLSTIDPRGDGRPKIPSRYSTLSPSETTPSSTVFSQEPRAASVATVDTTEGSTTEHVRHTSVAFDTPQESADVSKELQEALLTKDLKAVFARASNLIREAGGVDGTIFFDASVGSFGAASEKDTMGQKAPGDFHIEEAITTSEDDVSRRSLDTDTHINPTDTTHHGERCCNILGFSTRKRSSLKGHSAPPEFHNFPERVLRSLLKRYPHGKVFNFDEDGTYSSSDTDHAYPRSQNDADGPRKPTKSEETHRRRRMSREAEAAAFQKALPGVRSVFWFPLWDPSRERWYSGSLVWSTGTRSLCPNEDLTYLAAFGNSIMAEVARLSALVLTQMKTDFISSISHELRSPLHGVLASVEFLQETALTEVQADMVSNINASGRVLLDTINHVLDFSKVNKKVKGRGKVLKRRSNKEKRLSFRDYDHLDNTADDTADVCILSEEVMESVWAGRNMSKLLYGTPSSQQKSPPQSMATPPEDPVTVIMDITWQPSWTSEMDAGAWRRILMNLFGNSIKYTKSGFIKVSMIVEEEMNVRGKKVSSLLVLKVKDSGKGMSKEFLKHHLFKPFTQEDSLAVGAGLGLSIVRHIIQDLGGEINFTSEQGVGTEATVKLPMTLCPRKDDISDLVADVRTLTKGKKFHLEGFDRYPDISETPTGILSADSEAAMFLKSSMHVMLTEWFGMESSTVAISGMSAEVVVGMESGMPSLMEKLQSYGPGSGPSIAIILCSAYPPTGTATTYGSLRVFYVPQTYGPHKIAKTLHHAFTQSSSPARIPDTYSTPEFSVPATTSPLVFDPNTLSTGALLHTPQYHDFATPTPIQPLSQPPPIHVDRRASIDTSVIQPTGMRILLVEDNEINMKLLVAYMRKLKLNHATAINGLEALNRYKEANGAFDVIFMDISMPIMDGIESTRHIRRFERETAIQPVALIALTGAANPNTRQEAFSSGIDLFLTKPVPMKSLKVMLDNLKANGRQGLMV